MESTNTEPKTSGRAAQASPFSVEKKSNGVFVARMDVPGEAVNTLRATFADDFSRMLADVDRDPACRAVVVTSGKKVGFIAGADIEMLRAMTSEAEAADLCRTGHRVMDRIASFRVPVVAAIHGPALGGGLEIAMACHARIASDDKKTKLGLPEVMLGVLPGLGGTQRLPRTVPIEAALDLLLTGKQIDARRAKTMGLVDEVVPEAILLQVAEEKALELAASGKKDGLGKKLAGVDAWKDAALTRTGLGRKVVFDQARKELLKKSRGNYPAAERILDVVKKGLADGMEAGLDAEARAFGELVVSPISAALTSIFLAQTALKKDSGVDDPSVKARTVEKVGMLGAGLMGSGIAFVTTTIGGIPVRLKDKDADGVARGLGHVRSLVDERVKKKRITAREAASELALVTGTTGYDGLADCDVVIEAVFEDLALKHRVLADVEANAGPRTIFASNTSSLPITKIAEGAKRPENVIGMHYFSPVEKMPLLEVIAHPKTAPEVVATCVELGKRQGKTVIVVSDGVGFYTSRILAPYVNEASFILAEGVKVEDIDDALLDWGFPVGPMTLLDEVGLDVAEKVGHILLAEFGDRVEPPPGFEKLIADKRLGRKNGRGFYLYGDERKGKEKLVDPTVYGVLGLTPNRSVPKDEIATRCALMFVNEAAHCYGEGILRSARDGDIGAIFGLGFAPFRGGPFRWVDSLGVNELVRRMEHFRDRLGNRFAPAPVLVDMAKEGASFHGPKRIPPGMHRPVAKKSR